MVKSAPPDRLGPVSEANLEMVRSQLLARGIRDRRILKAFRRIDRAFFVPKEHQFEAYEDYPLPIGCGQTISQPYVVALMLVYLDVQPEHKVLEIGTGSGYSTALLSQLAHHVDSVEYYRELHESAGARLNRLGITNVDLYHGDGWQGPPVDRQYERIILWAAPPKPPEKLKAALSRGGLMVAPVGKRLQDLWIIQKKGTDEFKIRYKDPVAFVPLIRGEPL